jgi:hypothetical protein
MTVRRPSLLLAIWICWSGAFCLAQNPAEKFHWDSNNWQRDGWERIGAAKFLSAGERVLLIGAVADQLRSSVRDIEIESEEDLRKAAAQTQCKAVDLGGNGVLQFLVQSGGVGPAAQLLCSPTGNCESWVFRLHDNKYSMILHRTATQTFTIQSTMTNGFHDLVLGQHGSATDQGLTLYRFDGLKYRRIACYDANWEILGEDGEIHRLKKPRITPTICEMR